jgi:PhzF family phenazine biosynthesis protein
MKIPIYQIDSFTNQLFAGNPAAVCYLPHWLSDELLQNIAIENNLAETGFFLEKRHALRSVGS